MGAAQTILRARRRLPRAFRGLIPDTAARCGVLAGWRAFCLGSEATSVWDDHASEMRNKA